MGGVVSWDLYYLSWSEMDVVENKRFWSSNLSFVIDWLIDQSQLFQFLQVPHLFTKLRKLK